MGGQAASRSSQRTAGGAWNLADLGRTTLALALPPELPGKLLMGTLAALGVTAWEAGSRRHLWEPQAFWPHPEIEREFPAGAGGTRCPWGVRQRDHGRPGGGGPRPTARTERRGAASGEPQAPRPGSEVLSAAAPRPPAGSRQDLVGSLPAAMGSHCGLGRCPWRTPSQQGPPCSPGAERAPGRQPLAAGLALELTRPHAILGPCPHSQLRPRHGVQASGPTWLTSGLPTRWPIGRKASDAPTDP